jgi:L-asparaginase
LYVFYPCLNAVAAGGFSYYNSNVRKPKILLLFTGGTIAQVYDPAINGLRPAKTPKDMLKIAPELKDNFEIGYQIVVNIDSSNVQPNLWNTLSETIYKEYDNYDGFVITHGTDTMSYTASALSFSLTNLGKPVVFTGAHLYPDAPGSDARNNLINAFKVASMNLAEVVIVFGSWIVRGNRSTKKDEGSLETISSPIFPELGRIRMDIDLWNFSPKRDVKKRPILLTGFEEKIMVYTVFPGLQSRFIESILDTDVKGIIIRGYGPGDLPIEENSLIESITKFTKKNIPIVISSQTAVGLTKISIYETGIAAQKLGVISSADMTLEATITKLMWALHQSTDREKVRILMNKNIAGEITA